MRAGPLDRFLTVALPLARRDLVVAGTLAFAHTVGEFGVVLMLGGNIPGATRMVSIAIYDHVEVLEYPQAHLLSALMLGFTLLVGFLPVPTRNPRYSCSKLLWAPVCCVSRAR